MAEQTPPAMTVREVAGFLAVDEKTIYRLAQQGKLPGFKVAGTWRFQLQDIQGWIDEQKKQALKARASTTIAASRKTLV
jgi:excisionase family DNA binding protein